MSTTKIWSSHEIVACKDNGCILQTTPCLNRIKSVALASCARMCIYIFLRAHVVPSRTHLISTFPFLRLMNGLNLEKSSKRLQFHIFHPSLANFAVNFKQRVVKFANFSFICTQMFLFVSASVSITSPHTVVASFFYTFYS